ncbi:MAG: carboxypeptidase regulatory-like domain-containing protein, partial [Bryobacterales bacterium]|nr:carboxypeptidase regulatory-like domain-containing protein [Bryobacterales bacterium]
MRLLALLLISILSLTAQETRGVIAGRVLDPTGAAITGAIVLVTNTGTNNTVRAQSNDTGYYEANFLLPGDYRLTTEMTGF